MRWRWRLACAGAVAIGMAPVCAGAAENLFPVAQGNAWTLAGTVAGRPLRLDAKIVASTSTGGRTTAVMRWIINGRALQEETFYVTSAGVVRARSGHDGSIVIAPPVPILRYPVKVGDVWAWRGTATKAGQPPVAATATLRVAGRETVKSAIGEFQAYRVEMMLTAEAQGRRATVPNVYWFAPKVGLVRQQLDLPTRDGRSVTVTATVEHYTIR